jgi:hypothetical protein
VRGTGGVGRAGEGRGGQQHCAGEGRGDGGHAGTIGGVGVQRSFWDKIVCDWQWIVGSANFPVQPQGITGVVHRVKHGMNL